MPLRNRVDPWGDLHAVPSRGIFTGNRGCLVDDRGEIVRHHLGDLWIICLTSYRGWKKSLTKPGSWTPLFFFDEAVALAAGHRPCGLCRRQDYDAYRSAIANAEGLATSPSAPELNRRLADERLRPGRGISRARDRKTWAAEIANLPDGTIIVDDGKALLLAEAMMLTFSFDGWTNPRPRSPVDLVRVLTPPTSVSALRGGYRPKWNVG